VRVEDSLIDYEFFVIVFPVAGRLQRKGFRRNMTGDERHGATASLTAMRVGSMGRPNEPARRDVDLDGWWGKHLATS
jgi:hypothetical protein